MRRGEEDQATKFIRSMGNILIGGIFALGICLIILFVCSVAISSGWLNDRSMMQYTVAGCLIGGLAGGVLAVTRVRAKSLITGLMTAGVQFLLILLIGFLIYPGIDASEHGVSIAAACLAGGAIAGFLGGKPKKKRRK